MKKTRLIAALMAMLILPLQTIEFAASADTGVKPYDPRTMTLEERSQWVYENVEPVYSGQAEQIARSEWLVTTTEVTPIGPNHDYPVARLETQLTFLCNDSFTEVIDWSTLKFQPIAIGTALFDTEYVDNRLYPDNVSVVFTVWTACDAGAFVTEHWYNLHGRGAYDVRVVNAGPYR